MLRGWHVLGVVLSRPRYCVVAARLLSCSEARDIVIWNFHRGEWTVERRLADFPYICTSVCEIVAPMAAVAFEDGGWCVLNLEDASVPLQVSWVSPVACVCMRLNSVLPHSAVLLMPAQSGPLHQVVGMGC